MNEDKLHKQITKLCNDAITTAIKSFPEMLRRSEPEKAAQIVAQLIDSHLARPVPGPDPLDRIVNFYAARSKQPEKPIS